MYRQRCVGVLQIVIWRNRVAQTVYQLNCSGRPCTLEHPWQESAADRIILPHGVCHDLIEFTGSDLCGFAEIRQRYAADIADHGRTGHHTRNTGRNEFCKMIMKIGIISYEFLREDVRERLVVFLQRDLLSQTFRIRKAVNARLTDKR